jgi:hypothetical protein
MSVGPIQCQLGDITAKVDSAGFTATITALLYVHNVTIKYEDKWERIIKSVTATRKPNE